VVRGDARGPGDTIRSPSLRDWHSRARSHRVLALPEAMKIRHDRLLMAPRTGMVAETGSRRGDPLSSQLRECERPALSKRPGGRLICYWRGRPAARARGTVTRSAEAETSPTSTSRAGHATVRGLRGGGPQREPIAARRAGSGPERLRRSWRRALPTRLPRPASSGAVMLHPGPGRVLAGFFFFLKGSGCQPLRSTTRRAGRTRGVAIERLAP